MSSTPRKRPAPEALVAGAVVAILIALVAAVFLTGQGSTLYPPDAATSQGREVRGLYDIVFAFAVAIFVVVEGLIVWSVLRYRRKPTDVELPVQTHGNNLVEIIWTVIPTGIVLFLFVVSWQTLNTVDAVSAQPDIRVHAIAGQFAWQFEYLDENGNKVATQLAPVYDTDTSLGGMAVPVGRSIQVTLDSPDVIHAFYVPRFLFKRDVVPGQTNRFEFTIDEDEVGQVFRGQCAELCGTGHRAMLFNVIALSPADYDAWLRALIEANNATPAPLPSGPVLNVAAKNIAYDQATLAVPADAAFGIAFDNQDPPGVLHDIDIRDGSGRVVADKQTIDGGTQTNYAYDPLAAGSYTFFCSIHANMTGTLTAE
ncbi:MAG TPA: cytochrome c oxidase subunit II [Candidatus Limnocylindrales bacterium]|nr:cytochrome c oxidase subunit II [Candidatus Limnocylindrales bacterium]